MLSDANLKGFIPVDHLSDFGDLCSHLLATYLPGMLHLFSVANKIIH